LSPSGFSLELRTEQVDGLVEVLKPSELDGTLALPGGAL
jgi:hypothetical protein